MPKSLASFCRLCLTKTASKVPVFGGDQENVTNLLALIELSINSDTEPDAALCFECVVTLEAFLQFKDQCHVNDEFLKTLPPKDSAEVSEAGEEEEDDEDAMECDYLEEDDNEDDGGGSRESEEQGLVEELDHPSGSSPVKVIHKVVKVAKKKCEVDPLRIPKVVRTQKRKTKPKSGPKKVVVVPKKPPQKIPDFSGPEPTEDNLPKLRDSYPNFFHFERGSRSLYYDLIYYGERFNSAIYNSLHTYWFCAWKKTCDCPAVLYVSNDYTEFERRYEHTHGERPTKGEPELFTPQQALPTIFRICWNKVKERKVKQLEVTREKKERAQKRPAKPKPRPVARSKLKPVVLKKPVPKIPDFPGPQPTADELPKLKDSYPDFFYFERSHNTRFYDIVYYGERFNSPSFGSKNTYWYCAHRKKYKCPALLHTSNDYTKFERRYEHAHADQKPRKQVLLYTPKQALPDMFRICWHRVKKVVDKKLQMKCNEQLDDSSKDKTLQNELDFIEVVGNDVEVESFDD
ncbi:uncharacterized protein LOC6034278 isoform X2 [Culex quinquefasciatus]|uniref:uncharacterized protein LOC6034278 isoform X2 n=1 Tax=Culex quinquefasciatus TaxID=7176 RepID=UPI0018E3CD90|nr:uncharacterized protein LOC6034278 isoform X2 [Culex quinquefasciatus]